MANLEYEMLLSAFDGAIACHLPLPLRDVARALGSIESRPLVSLVAV